MEGVMRKFTCPCGFLNEFDESEVETETIGRGAYYYYLNCKSCGLESMVGNYDAAYGACTLWAERWDQLPQPYDGEKEE
jgi:hypothetical protein